jgi:hypothetical protein
MSADSSDEELLADGGVHGFALLYDHRHGQHEQCHTPERNSNDRTEPEEPEVGGPSAYRIRFTQPPDGPIVVPSAEELEAQS